LKKIGAILDVLNTCCKLNASIIAEGNPDEEKIGAFGVGQLFTISFVG
jgi:hypothetical protein